MMSTSASGMSTVQENRWSWSSRSRGYVARSQMMKKDNAPIFPDIQMNPGMNDRPGMGWYPPRNSTDAMAESATIPPYSASRKNANRRPVYSVYAPKMISESAMGMSNGGRVSSASEDTMKMPNPTICGNTYHIWCWDWAMPIRDSVPACITTAAAARINGSS